MEKHEIDFYKKLATENRGTPRQIGYGSKMSQDIRFATIQGVLGNFISDYDFNHFDGIHDFNNPLAHFTILDFGCGKGDFAKFVKCKKYYGVDAIEENIEDAKNTKFDNDVEFKLLNWDGKSTIFREKPDIVVFSGCFATTAPEVRNDLFLKLLNLSNYGIAGSFLTSNEQVKKYEDGCILTNPIDIFKLIDRSRFMVKFDASYLPHDFVIGAMKWPNLIPASV